MSTKVWPDSQERAAMFIKPAVLITALNTVNMVKTQVCLKDWTSRMLILSFWIILDIKRKLPHKQVIELEIAFSMIVYSKPKLHVLIISILKFYQQVIIFKIWTIFKSYIINYRNWKTELITLCIFFHNHHSTNVS